GQDRHPERLGRLGRDALGEDVVSLQREIGVLLRRPEREYHPIVALEVLLELHPVQVTDAHHEAPSGNTLTSARALRSGGSAPRTSAAVRTPRLRRWRPRAARRREARGRRRGSRPPRAAARP